MKSVSQHHRIAALRCSLSGAERSPCLKEVRDVTRLVLRVQLEVVLHALLALCLAVEVLVIIPADGLSFILIERLRLLVYELGKPFLRIGESLLVVLGVHDAQHLVVSVVDVQLHWVLVVCEQRIVTICQVRQGTTLYK